MIDIVGTRGSTAEEPEETAAPGRVAVGQAGAGRIASETEGEVPSAAFGRVDRAEARRGPGEAAPCRTPETRTPAEAGVRTISETGS